MTESDQLVGRVTDLTLDLVKVGYMLMNDYLGARQNKLSIRRSLSNVESTAQTIVDLCVELRGGTQTQKAST